MRKRLIVGAMLCTFLGSAVFTVLSANAAGCLRCKKQGCPQGYCYFDCVSCCYNDPQYPYPVCFK